MENNQGENKEHDFTVQTWKEDFCFVVEGKRFYVARIILALASPVFERMFQADFKEKDQKEMELPDKRSADVEEFLKCIYPGVMKEVTIKNAFQIIALAEEYQVVTLKAKCEECFLSAVDKNTAVETLFKILRLACLYSLSTVIEKGSKFAAEKPLAELDKYTIPPPVMCAIQRKIIDKMKVKERAKELEIKTTIDELVRDKQKMIVLYKYHRAGVENKKEILEIDNFVGWDGISVYKKVNIDMLSSWKFNERISLCVCNFVVCNTQFGIAIDYVDGCTQLSVSVPETDLKYASVKLVGNIVVFNGSEGKRNFCKKVEMVFNRRNKSLTVSLLNFADLRNENYIYKGNIRVECNFLVLRRNY